MTGGTDFHDRRHTAHGTRHPAHGTRYTVHDAWPGYVVSRQQAGRQAGKSARRPALHGRRPTPDPGRCPPGRAASHRAVNISCPLSAVAATVTKLLILIEISHPHRHATNLLFGGNISLVGWMGCKNRISIIPRPSSGSGWIGSHPNADVNVNANANDYANATSDRAQDAHVKA